MLFSFQIANVHPPAVRIISLKKGDRSNVLTGPSCASKTISGLGAEIKKNTTPLVNGE